MGKNLKFTVINDLFAGVFSKENRVKQCAEIITMNETKGIPIKRSLKGSWK